MVNGTAKSWPKTMFTFARRPCTWLGLPMLGLLAAACGIDSAAEISLKQAKAITADFQSVKLFASPKRDDSLYKFLNKIKLPAGGCKRVLSSQANDLDFANKFNSLSGSSEQAGGASEENQRQNGLFLEIAGRQVAAGDTRGAIALLEKQTTELGFGNNRQKARMHAQLSLTHAIIGNTSDAVSHARAGLSAVASMSINTSARTSSRSRGNTYQNYVTLFTNSALAADAYANGQFRAAAIFTGELISKRLHSYGWAAIRIDSNLILVLHMRALRRNGQFKESELQARRYIAHMADEYFWYDENKDFARHAMIFNELAEALLAQNRVGEAIKFARRAVKYHKFGCTNGKSIALVQSQQVLAKGLARQGHWGQVLEVISDVRKAMASDTETFNRYFAQFIEWPLALIHMDKAAAAIPHLVTMRRHANSDGSVAGDTLVSVDGLLALALARAGETEKALVQFRQTFAALLVKRHNYAGRGNVEVHSPYQDQILAGYLDLLFHHIGATAEATTKQGLIVEMLQVAAAQQSRSLQNAVAASATRAAARDSGLQDLVRREQDAGKNLEFVLDRLVTLQQAATRKDGGKLKLQLQNRAKDLRRARTAIRTEIKKGFPNYLQHMAPKPLMVAEIQSLLANGESLLFYHVAKQRTYVWAIPKNGRVAWAASSLGRAALKLAVDSLRNALEPDVRVLDEIPAFDVSLAHRLYKELMAPVEPGWVASKHLLLVVNEALGYLPFHLLPRAPAAVQAGSGPMFSEYKKVKWLARSHAQSVLPSLSSLRILRRAAAGKTARSAFAGFGDPYFSQKAARTASRKNVQLASNLSPARQKLTVRGLRIDRKSIGAQSGINSADLALLPQLPETADELRTIARALKVPEATTVFTGRAASEGKIKAMDLSKIKVIAFATHGLVPGDLRGLTQPALALSSPNVTNEPNEDGVLTMGEIFSLKLNADWVVLSACNTAAGDGAGAAAVSGLGRAFFYAGTKALLVSNWPIETNSAKLLTAALFQRQAESNKTGRVEALRQSMMALIDGPGVRDAKGRTLYSYAHPIFWGPFNVVGEGG